MDTIKLITAAEEPVIPVKGAMPMPDFNRIKTNIIELSSEMVKAQIEENLSAMLRIVSNVNINANGARIDEMKLSLGITASGEVGFFSVAKGALSGTAAIEFVIKID